MRLILVAAAALSLTPSLALAQYGGYQNPYTQQQRQEPQRPRSSYTYDPQSGNAYTTHRQQNGGATIYGNNVQNGSTWNTRVQPNGNATGTDANGNMWNYNARTGSYMNSDGTTCFGKGAARVCN